MPGTSTRAAGRGRDRLAVDHDAAHRRVGDGRRGGVGPRAAGRREADLGYRDAAVQERQAASRVDGPARAAGEPRGGGRDAHADGRDAPAAGGPQAARPGPSARRRRPSRRWRRPGCRRAGGRRSPPPRAVGGAPVWALAADTKRVRTPSKPTAAHARRSLTRAIVAVRTDGINGARRRLRGDRERVGVVVPFNVRVVASPRRTGSSALPPSLSSAQENRLLRRPRHLIALGFAGPRNRRAPRVRSRHRDHGAGGDRGEARRARPHPGGAGRHQHPGRGRRGGVQRRPLPARSGHRPDRREHADHAPDREGPQGEPRRSSPSACATCTPRPSRAWPRCSSRAAASAPRPTR